MIIYGSTLSPFVRKVVAVAREKGLEFDIVVTSGADPDPGFVKASPLLKMPAVEDDGFTLADSSAIAHYLEAKHPDPVLIPTDPQGRGETVWWDEYADTVLFGCIRKMFFNRVVSPIFLKREGDESVAGEAEASELPPVLDFLEGRVPAAGDFLVGGRLSLADIAVASPMANLSHVGVVLDKRRHPRLSAWAASMLARPSLSLSVDKERALLERLKG